MAEAPKTPETAEKAAAAPRPAKHVKKRKKPAKQEVLWTVRLEQFWTAFMAQVREIGRGVVSKDGPTRFASILFFASVLGMAATIAYSSRHYYIVHQIKVAGMARGENQDAKHFGAFIEKQAEEAKRRYTLIPLGDFTVELKAVSGQKPVPGVVNMAEVELVAECDNKITCGYMEDHLPQVRDQITSVLTAIDRDELLSREGKRKLKKSLMDRLNKWLGDGQVQNLYISKLIVT